MKCRVPVASLCFALLLGFHATAATPSPSSGLFAGLADFTAHDESTFDPAGYVIDINGIPLAGARVILYRSDDPLGAFLAVPGGSAIMSPANRANPDLTGVDGHFGWDVVAGFYKVRAEMNGFIPVESDVLSIPPAANDLRLILQPSVPEPSAVLILLGGALLWRRRAKSTA